MANAQPDFSSLGAGRANQTTDQAVASNGKYRDNCEGMSQEQKLPLLPQDGGPNPFKNVQIPGT